jgi:hypothetical protein
MPGCVRAQSTSNAELRRKFPGGGWYSHRGFLLSRNREYIALQLRKTPDSVMPPATDECLE